MAAVTFVDATDCNPPHGLDLESAHDRDKVNILVEAFQRSGFDLTQPALVGYVLDGRIQLLSGTHRHEAARRTGTKLPVTLWLQTDVKASWGRMQAWAKVMRDVSVAELLLWTREDLARDQWRHWRHHEAATMKCVSTRPAAGRVALHRCVEAPSLAEWIRQVCDGHVLHQSRQNKKENPMISAAHALALPSAQVSDSDRRAAAAILAELDAHVRQNVTPSGLVVMEVAPERLNPIICQEVGHEGRRQGWVVQFQERSERSAVMGGRDVVVGYQIVISPTDAARDEATAARANGKSSPLEDP